MAFFFGRPVASWKLRGVGFFGLDWVATQNRWGSPPSDTFHREPYKMKEVSKRWPRSDGPPPTPTSPGAVSAAFGSLARRRASGDGRPPSPLRLRSATCSRELQAGRRGLSHPQPRSSAHVPPVQLFGVSTR